MLPILMQFVLAVLIVAGAFVRNVQSWTDRMAFCGELTAAFTTLMIVSFGLTLIFKNSRIPRTLALSSLCCAGVTFLCAFVIAVALSGTA